MSVVSAAEFERAWGEPLLDREGFDAMVGAAITERRGFAAGKLGGSEQAWLVHPIEAQRETDPRRLRAVEIALAARSLRHAGVFPTDPAFLRRFADEFAVGVGELDAIGLFADGLGRELDVLRFHNPSGLPMHYQDQEPDRSLPADDAGCWLRHLRGRRILLVCPFAGFLAERADRETFEAVWAKTGKRWFDPASVASLELPYGFAADTRERYETVWDLFAEVCERIDAQEYDVALIAAGGLGIPLAAHVKRRDRVAVSLGGHLQVLFGVLGERWLGRPLWHRDYFNESWVRLPARYLPERGASGEDYW